MQNIKLTIAYDGTRYAGWQRQTSHDCSPIRRHSKRTIQEEIESVLAKIFHKKIYLIGSGRTDAGVHAAAQVANFKAATSMPMARLQKALNANLPRDIAVTDVARVPLSFHARFQAKSKIYRYLIAQSKTKAVLPKGLVWWVKYSLDVALMQKESCCLVGRHDFSSLQATDRNKRKSTTSIISLVVKKQKGPAVLPLLKDTELLSIDIRATGFLRNMVRNIVGTLIEIGRGKIPKGELRKILLKKDRAAAGPCAPACGLYLLGVNYDVE
ncbi:MAG: tRNA pseudouridine(38-40) synthase TruA [Candidatus Omnitrophota bacterium]